MAASTNCPPPAGGQQFKATRTWNSLIKYLKENANVKRRRNIMRSSDECFTGANAVDVLLQFVKQNPEQFPNTGVVARDNILRLCQAFIENGVIEPIGSVIDSDKYVKFEDSTSAFYNFVEREVDDDLKTKSSRKRQVLKEIDGEIRNSMDHISISGSAMKPRSQTMKVKHRHSPMPTRHSSRPRFPSIAGISARSFKDSFLSSTVTRGTEETRDTRSGRALKRSSSYDGTTLKRSSSESQLSTAKSHSSSSSENEHSEGKDKKLDELTRGGRLRLSERLSFRRKYSSPSSRNDVQEQSRKAVGHISRGNKTTSKASSKLATWNKPPIQPRRDPVNPLPDPRRQSLAARSETDRSPAVLRRVLTATSLMLKPKTRVKQNGQVYSPVAVASHLKSDLNVHQAIDAAHHAAPFKVSTRSRVRCSAAEPEMGLIASPPKQRKENRDEIKETPSRFGARKRTSFGSVAAFANRMSQRRRSQRRKEMDASNNSKSCVIKNLATANPLSMAADNIKRTLSARELLHLRRECVRVRLLQILDLQFVDDLIASPTDKRSCQDGDVLGKSHSNPAYGEVQYSEVVAAYSSADQWISLAVDVLRHIPNGYAILQRHARDDVSTKKLKLFFAICDYYKSMSTPLVDETMREICDAIIDMLAMKPISDSLEACQLFLNLLPDAALDELRHLIIFLHCVVTSDDVVLVSGNSNKSVILRCFPSSIFCTSEARHAPCTSSGTDHGTAGLFLFILEQKENAFTLPPDVAATLKRKRHLMEVGEIESPSILSDSTFCTMISVSEYDKQRVEYTRMQVSELARSITDERHLAPKKKKELLKKLQASHPSAFEHVKGPMKAMHPGPSQEAQTPNVRRKIPPTHQIPNTEPTARRRNKSGQKQIYV